MTDPGRTGRLDVLVEGYAPPADVAGTVSLVRDADRVVVVDPGCADPTCILRPMRELGVRPRTSRRRPEPHHLGPQPQRALFPVVPVHDFQSGIEG
jgi:hypothetical protein